jgi:hypothetical protein
LRLSRNQTHACIQGISNVNNAAPHGVSIHLRSRHSDWHTTLDYVVSPNIKGTTPFTKLDTSSWKIPHIKLADEQFDQPGSIDPLFGVGLFCEILRSGKRTCPGNFPVLQETVLGCTLSGRTPAVTALTDTQYIFLLRDDSNLEHDLNCFWEVEPMVQPTMTTEQQECEEHFLTHTTARWKIRC